MTRFRSHSSITRTATSTATGRCGSTAVPPAGRGRGSPARASAAAICKQHGLVLMDDTVMLASVQLRKEDPVNAWGLKYRFEFARQGIRHTGGSVILAPGHRPVTVIETDEGSLIEHF